MQKKYTFLITIIYFVSKILNNSLNSSKHLMILHQIMLNISKFFSYKTMVKPNFLVDKANIKHKPSIFTKKYMLEDA